MLTHTAATFSRFKPQTMYWAAFFVALHIGLPLYVTSAFLGQFVSEPVVGLLFSASAVLGLLLLASTPKILSRIGNYRAVAAIVVLEVASLWMLALSTHPVAIGIAFLAVFAMHWLLLFHLDIFLEDGSNDRTTGATRGAYLTALSLGILFAPAIAGILTVTVGFRIIYLLAAFTLLVMFVLLRANFRHFRDPIYRMIRFRAAIKTIVARPQFWRVTATNFLLYLFFSWMTVYLPLYLKTSIGFSWPEIGVLFAIMLSPFVLFEWPLGRLADTRLGEKELLIVGGLIIAFSTAALSFIGNANFLVWAIALFLTRTGASMIEVMSEAYFFKQVKSADASLVAVFRMNRPLGYALGPALAGIFLAFFDTKFLFLALGAIMLVGIPIAWGLRDTK